MKICIINSLYSPDRRGGAEVIAERVAQGLLNQGHEVLVITCGRDDKQELIDGVKVFRLKANNIFNFLDINSQPVWKRVIWHLVDQLSLTNAELARQIIKLEKPDLILTHNLKGIGYQLVRVLGRMDVEWIHTLHDIQLVVPSGLIIKGQENAWLIRNPYNWIYSLINRRIFSRVKKVISPSQWLLDYYYNYGFFKKSATNVLKNPMVIDRQFVAKDFNQTYLFHGQIEEHKGVRMLLTAFEQFVVNHPQAKLLISGEGRLESELTEKYQSSRWVEFLGYNDHQSLSSNVFPRASYLIVPSLCYENSPGIIQASYLNSTPVLAARIGGIAEMVEDTVNGFVFKAGDVSSLLVALQLTVDESDRYDELNTAAYGSVTEFSLEKYLEELFAIIKF